MAEATGTDDYKVERTPSAARTRAYRVNHSALLSECLKQAQQRSGRGAFLAVAHLSESQLRDSAAQILMGIAADMRSTQSAVQQKAKSRRSEGGSQSGFDQVAYLHAEERLAHGFGINEVVAEFRALRGGDLDFRAILRLERLRLLAA